MLWSSPAGAFFFRENDVPAFVRHAFYQFVCFCEYLAQKDKLVTENNLPYDHVCKCTSIWADSIYRTATIVHLGNSALHSLYLQSPTGDVNMVAAPRIPP
jgi:hypothetical protein